MGELKIGHIEDYRGKLHHRAIAAAITFKTLPMADFYLLAVIRQTDPAEFVVLVSTMPHEDTDLPSSVDTAVSDSLAEAQALMSEMMVEVGERVVARGDRIVDVVDD